MNPLRALVALALVVWTGYVYASGGLVALIPTACVAGLYAAWRLYELLTRHHPTDGIAEWQRQTDALARRPRRP